MKLQSITMADILNGYSKSELESYARKLGIRGISGVKKSQLTEKITERILEPEVMRKRVASFSVNQRKMLERAMEAPFKVHDDEIQDAMWLAQSDYVYLSEDDMLYIPQDIGAVYKGINTPEFALYAKKMSWLVECLEFAMYFYGIFDKEILLTMYNDRKGYRISREELDRLCDDLPKEATSSEWVEQDGQMKAVDLEDDEELSLLVQLQGDTDFYMPYPEEVLDYIANFYLSEDKAYVELRKFFQKELEMDREDAHIMAGDVWDRISLGQGNSGIAQYVLGRCRCEVSEEKKEILTKLLKTTSEQTRLLIYRGHTTQEMMVRENHKREDSKNKKKESGEKKQTRTSYPKEPKKQYSKGYGRNNKGFIKIS